MSYRFTARLRSGRDRSEMKTLSAIIDLGNFVSEGLCLADSDNSLNFDWYIS